MCTRLAPILALGPILVLLVALHVHADAAVRLRTIPVEWCAHVIRPLRCRPNCHGRCGRSAQANGLTRPAGVGACNLASPEVVALLVALLSRILAATDLRAIAPPSNALVRNPWLCALLRLPELPARPWEPVQIVEVGAAGDAGGLACGPALILLVACHARLPAALRLPAVHAWVSARVLARCALAQRLATPSLAIPMRRVWTSRACCAALRIAGVLLVALHASCRTALGHIAIAPPRGARIRIRREPNHTRCYRCRAPMRPSSG
mmetsp:Transcript_12277/g.33528  ORF Transcript_12277/g.33528 Transcript_12277/m.33528 type:complete len:265 (-) Transcript_12277:227-1021(-)